MFERTERNDTLKIEMLVLSFPFGKVPIMDTHNTTHALLLDESTKDWSGLSTHPNLTIQHLLEFPDKPWSWNKVSKHPNITIDDIIHHELPWSMECVGGNPNMTIQDIQRIQHRLIRTSWIHLTLNRSIPIKDMLDNPHFPWDWVALQHRTDPEITLDFLLSLSSTFQWQYLSEHPNIKVDDVKAHPEIPWDWFWLSKNPNMTHEFVSENPDKPWSAFWLSKVSNIHL